MKKKSCSVLFTPFEICRKALYTDSNHSFESKYIHHKLHWPVLYVPILIAASLVVRWIDLVILCMSKYYLINKLLLLVVMTRRVCFQQKIDIYILYYDMIILFCYFGNSRLFVHIYVSRFLSS
jgi:hypothetical protein